MTAGWGEREGLPSDQQQARNCIQQGRGREPRENKRGSQLSIPPKLAPHQAQTVSHHHMLPPLAVTFLYPFNSCKSSGAKQQRTDWEDPGRILVLANAQIKIQS